MAAFAIPVDFDATEAIAFVVPINNRAIEFCIPQIYQRRPMTRWVGSGNTAAALEPWYERPRWPMSGFPAITLQSQSSSKPGRN